MVKLRLLSLVAVALAVCAVGAASASGPEGDVTTHGSSLISLDSGFLHLVPPFAMFQQLDVTYTAHFEDGGVYWAGGSVGKGPNVLGTVTFTMDLASLTWNNPHTPLQWVRVCLRPTGSPLLTEVTGSDGHAICTNTPGGGFRYDYDADAGEYADTAQALVTAATVDAATTADAKAALDAKIRGRSGH